MEERINQVSALSTIHNSNFERPNGLCVRQYSTVVLADTHTSRSFEPFVIAVVYSANNLAFLSLVENAWRLGKKCLAVGTTHNSNDERTNGSNEWLVCIHILRASTQQQSLA
jgi:hypothetical protein